MASELQYDTDHPMICVCSKRKVFMKTKYEMKQIKIHIGRFYNLKIKWTFEYLLHKN